MSTQYFKGIAARRLLPEKAAFFGYFLCSSKESDCRPAQGQC
jgi:hypothetical protein